jgi:hypothetical protein
MKQKSGQKHLHCQWPWPQWISRRFTSETDQLLETVPHAEAECKPNMGFEIDQANVIVGQKGFCQLRQPNYITKLPIRIPCWIAQCIHATVSLRATRLTNDRNHQHVPDGDKPWSWYILIHHDIVDCMERTRIWDPNHKGVKSSKGPWPNRSLGCGWSARWCHASNLKLL